MFKLKGSCNTFLFQQILQFLHQVLFPFLLNLFLSSVSLLLIRLLKQSKVFSVRFLGAWHNTGLIVLKTLRVVMQDMFPDSSYLLLALGIVIRMAASRAITPTFIGFGCWKQTLKVEWITSTRFLWSLLVLFIISSNSWHQEQNNSYDAMQLLKMHFQESPENSAT